MAYETFISPVESARLLKEVEKNFVFAADCNREYEGDVKERGDSVRILAVGKPQIYDLIKDSANAGYTGTGKDVIQKDIGSPEEIENASKTLQINQISFFHYMIGDIDKAQSSKKNLMPIYREETAKGLAEKMDKYIAKKMATTAGIENAYATNKTDWKVVSGTPSSSDASEVNVLDFIDDKVIAFNDNDISDATELVMEVSPRFWKVLKKAYRELDTDNTVLLAGRKLGKYNDVTIKKSTACYKADGSNDYVFIRTRRAVAFVNPLTHTEAYRPEKGFADAVKGYTLYDCDVVREKEVITSKVTYEA